MSSSMPTTPTTGNPEYFGVFSNPDTAQEVPTKQALRELESVVHSVNTMAGVANTSTSTGSAGKKRKRKSIKEVIYGSLTRKWSRNGRTQSCGETTPLPSSIEGASSSEAATVTDEDRLITLVRSASLDPSEGQARKRSKCSHHAYYNDKNHEDDARRFRSPVVRMKHVLHKNCRGVPQPGTNIVIVFSDRCKVSVDWCKYLTKMFTPEEVEEDEGAVLAQPLEKFSEHVDFDNERLAFEAERTSHARVQIIIVSPSLLSWVLWHPELVIGRMFHTPRILALMLGTTDDDVWEKHSESLVSFAEWRKFSVLPKDTAFAKKLYKEVMALLGHKFQVSAQTQTIDLSLQSTTNSNRVLVARPTTISLGNSKILLLLDGLPPHQRLKAQITVITERAKSILSQGDHYSWLTSSAIEVQIPRDAISRDTQRTKECISLELRLDGLLFGSVELVIVPEQSRPLPKARLQQISDGSSSLPQSELPGLDQLGKSNITKKEFDSVAADSPGKAAISLNLLQPVSATTQRREKQEVFFGIDSTVVVVPQFPGGKVFPVTTSGEGKSEGHRLPDNINNSADDNGANFTPELEKGGSEEIKLSPQPMPNAAVGLCGSDPPMITDDNVGEAPPLGEKPLLRGPQDHLQQQRETSLSPSSYEQKESSSNHYALPRKHPPPALPPRRRTKRNSGGGGDDQDNVGTPFTTMKATASYIPMQPPLPTANTSSPIGTRDVAFKEGLYLTPPPPVVADPDSGSATKPFEPRYGGLAPQKKKQPQSRKEMLDSYCHSPQPFERGAADGGGRGNKKKTNDGAEVADYKMLGKDDDVGRDEDEVMEELPILAFTPPSTNRLPEEGRPDTTSPSSRPHMTEFERCQAELIELQEKFKSELITLSEVEDRFEAWKRKPEISMAKGERQEELEKMREEWLRVQQLAKFRTDKESQVWGVFRSLTLKSRSGRRRKAASEGSRSVSSPSSESEATATTMPEPQMMMTQTTRKPTDKEVVVGPTAGSVVTTPVVRVQEEEREYYYDFPRKLSPEIEGSSRFYLSSSHSSGMQMQENNVKSTASLVP